MGQKVVTMEIKYAAVFAAVQSGRETVTAVCARLGISRTSYYKYRGRFAAEGLVGLEPRSRRPRSSPNRVPSEMARLIIQARDRLAVEGWDNGALSIRNRLLRDGHQPPTWRTVHRVLVGAGRVEPQPKKKPRSGYRRFEFPAPDDCWQIDAFDYRLAGGTMAVVFEIKDDCSRTQIANLAWAAEETTGAWECIARGIDDFALPLMLLSDNSLAFSGRLHQQVVLVEKNLVILGIQPITSRPWHPQTCGKNERGHQTLQHWLAARPQAATLTELQQLLDCYQTAFNHRPHQALDDNQTPLERRVAAARPAPPRGPVPDRTIVRHCQGRIGGYLSFDGYHIAIGRELAGRSLLVFATGDHLLIFYKHYLVRELTLDRTRRYQRLAEPRRRDRNRTQLQLDLQIGTDQPAARPEGQALRPAPPSPARGCRGSGSRAAAGRRAAIAPATLEAEKQPPYNQRGVPATPTPVSAMS